MTSNVCISIISLLIFSLSVCLKCAKIYLFIPPFLFSLSLSLSLSPPIYLSPSLSLSLFLSIYLFLSPLSPSLPFFSPFHRNSCVFMSLFLLYLIPFDQLSFQISLSFFLSISPSIYFVRRVIKLYKSVKIKRKTLF